MQYPKPMDDSSKDDRGMLKEALHQRQDAIRERDEMRAVLRDLVLSRDLPEWMVEVVRAGPWVAEVVRRRSVMLGALRQSFCVSSPSNPGDCDGHQDHHRPNCLRGIALRALGGPEETQRQVDAAHESVWLAPSPCPDCHGFGFTTPAPNDAPCDRCNGTGNDPPGAVNLP